MAGIEYKIVSRKNNGFVVSGAILYPTQEIYHLLEIMNIVKSVLISDVFYLSCFCGLDCKSDHIA